MNWVFFSLISSWLGIASVEGIFSRMPKGELISVEYHVSGTAAGYQYYYLVERQKDGTVVLKAMKEEYGEIIEKKVDAKVLSHIRDIIKSHKMYKYKERYLPYFDVRDGYMWGFYAKFSDGESISSRGSNAWPKDDGLGAIRAYITEVLTAVSR